MRKTNKKSLAFLLFLIIISQVNVLVSDAEGVLDLSIHVNLSGFSDTSIIGLDTEATEGFDSSFDEVEPISPPTGIVSYLWHPDNPTSPVDLRKLSKSYLRDSFPAQWSLKVETVGIQGDANLEWESLTYGVPQNCIVMLETPTGTINMRETAEYTWTTTVDTTYSFNITITLETYTLSMFDQLFKNNNVTIVYPSENTPKPLDCGAAMVSDWTASAFIYTKLEYVNEGLDTEPGYVNQATGKPVGESGTGIISFGGSLVNPVVKYSENEDTPMDDRAPVGFNDEGGVFYFQYANGTNIPGAELPVSVINDDKDLFVIEVFKDGDGRYVMLCYGFGWKGTYAAGKYFNNEVYPNLEDYPYSWIIVKWEDTNGNGFVNSELDGDMYTLIAHS